MHDLLVTMALAATADGASHRPRRQSASRPGPVTGLDAWADWLLAG